MEVWKQISGYEQYQISNWGRVRSIKNKFKLMSTTITPSGYCVVTLTISKNKHITKSVHRLVAEAFIPNPDNLPCVNHKDQIKSNNNVDNLEWCTYKYNLNYLDRNEKLSKSKLGKSVNSGINNPMYGKKHSLETRAKISKRLKGKFKGESNPMYGKKHRKESIQKMSQTKRLNRIKKGKEEENE